jgi:hypothetical protein
VLDSHSPLEKDRILREAFLRLKARGIDSAWSTSQHPYSLLREECEALMTDHAFKTALQAYLRGHSILPRAMQMFFTYIAMSARAKWQDAPHEHRPTAARGWFLGRWLPTFLVIDGPIGRFLTSHNSPLAARLGADLPLLTAAKALLMARTFRALRNGFAHWGFDWEVVGAESYVVAYDWERDLPIAKLHQGEADAYHIAAFALLDIVHETLLRPQDGRDEARC